MAENLEPFHGMPVNRCAVQITKAGDGLSDALKVDPIELNIGERVFYVLEGEVGQVKFRRIHPASNELERVAVITTQRITAVDGADVGAYLDDAEQHVRRALAEISDDQTTLDDELAEREAAAKAAESNGAGGDEVSGLVDEVKKARAAKKAAASTGAV